MSTHELYIGLRFHPFSTSIMMGCSGWCSPNRYFSASPRLPDLLSNGRWVPFDPESDGILQAAVDQGKEVPGAASATRACASRATRACASRATRTRYPLRHRTEKPIGRAEACELRFNRQRRVVVMWDGCVRIAGLGITIVHDRLCQKY